MYLLKVASVPSSNQTGTFFALTLYPSWSVLYWWTFRIFLFLQLTKTALVQSIFPLDKDSQMSAIFKKKKNDIQLKAEGLTFSYLNCTHFLVWLFLYQLTPWWVPVQYLVLVSQSEWLHQTLYLAAPPTTVRGGGRWSRETGDVENVCGDRKSVV